MTPPATTATTSQRQRAPRPLEELTRGAERFHVWRRADGEPLLAVVVRRRDDGEKDVWIVRPVPEGWIPERPQRPESGWPLYRLPELLAADVSLPVVVVEGEKDADRLAELGYVATTNLFGAGKARSMDWTPLAGRHVIVLPDHDTVGRDHAMEVVDILRSIGAASVTLVPLPGKAWGDDLPRKKGRDVSDWLDDGGQVDDLLAADASAKPEGPPDHPVGLPEPRETERASSARMMSWRAWGEARPVDYVVPDLVPAGAFVMLYGPPGSGKSLIALDWAIRAADDGLAVYVVGEGADGIPGRLGAWHRVHDAEPAEELHLWRGAVQVVDTGQLADLVENIKRVAAERKCVPRLVVLDTLARCSLGLDENSAGDAALVAAAVEKLQELGVAVVVVHHPDKGGRGLRGSGAYLAAIDLSLRVEARGHKHTVTVEKDKIGGREGLRVEYERVVFELGRDDDGKPFTGVAVRRASADDRVSQGAGEPVEGHGSITENRRRFLLAVDVLDAEGTPATLSAIMDRARLMKNRAADCAKWALGCGAVVGGGGVSYRPGEHWPADVPRQVRSGPDWSGSGPAGPAVLGPVRSGGPIGDPGSDQPDRSADPDPAGPVGERGDRGAA